MKQIYFSHPLRTYGSSESKEILGVLKRVYPDYQIINPETYKKTPWVSCKECMQKTMKGFFFPRIEECDLFVIWAPIITCGITCELNYAWQLGKKVDYVSLQNEEVELETLTLQEYHYIREASEVK